MIVSKGDAWHKFLVLLVLSFSSMASSEYRQWQSYVEDESAYESSQYSTATPNESIWDDEERIVSALGRIQDVEQPEFGHPGRKRRRARKRGKTGSRRKAGKKSSTTLHLRNDTNAGRQDAKKNADTTANSQLNANVRTSPRKKPTDVRKTLLRKTIEPTRDFQTEVVRPAKQGGKKLTTKSSGTSPKAAAAPSVSLASVEQQHDGNLPNCRISIIRPTSPITWKIPSIPHEIMPQTGTSSAAHRPPPLSVSSPRQASSRRPTNSRISNPPNQSTLIRRVSTPQATARQSLSPTSKDASSSSTPWIRRYLASRPKDILLPVPKEYLSDGFNLAQLAPIIERIGFQAMGESAVDIAEQLVQQPQEQQTSYPVYRLALRLILSEDDANQSILQHPLIPPHAIEEAAQALYLLVHGRFVASPR